MNPFVLPALAASALLVSACASAPAPSPFQLAPSAAATPAPAGNVQLAFSLASGTYHCDLGAQVEVQRDAPDAGRIRIGWTGREFELTRSLSHSGLPRYEDAASGLVWIDLPWKSLLLDAQRNKPLASECRPAAAA